MFAGLAVKAPAAAADSVGFDDRPAAPSAFTFLSSVADEPVDPSPTSSFSFIGGVPPEPEPAPASSDVDFFSGLSVPIGSVEPSPASEPTPAPLIISEAPAPGPPTQQETLLSPSVPSPPMDSYESQLKALNDTISRIMVDHWKAMQAIDHDEAAVRATKLDLLQRIAVANSDLESLVAAQGKAVEDEAYDQADELDTKIKASRRAIRELQTELERCEEKDPLRKSVRFEAVSKCTEAVLAVVHDLTNLKEQSGKEAREYVEKALSLITGDEAHLNEERDRFDRIMDIVAVDLQRVQSEVDRIEAVIQEKTKDEHDERGKLNNKIKKCHEEIEALRAQIAAKETEVVRLKESLAEADRQISQARFAFDRQLMRLENQKSRIEKDRAEILVDQAEVTNRLHRLEREKDRISRVDSRNADFAATIDDKVRARTAMVERMRADQILEQRRLLKAQELEKAVESAKQNLADQERRMHVITQQKATLEASMLTHEGHIETANSTLPGLEEAKNKAVSSRDFKTAARISKEIKSMTALRDESRELIDKTRHEIDAIGELIAGHHSHLEAARTEFAAAEFNVEKHTFECIQDRLQSLDEALDAAEDVEVNMLQKEINELTDRARQLSDKHNWPLRKKQISANPSGLPSSRDSSPRSTRSPARRPVSSTRSPSPVGAEVRPEPHGSEHDTAADEADAIPAADRLRQTVALIRNLEELLEASVLRDDFDEAARLQERITAAERDRSRLESLAPARPSGDGRDGEQNDDDEETRVSKGVDWAAASDERAVADGALQGEDVAADE
ncbi:hypothetical protein PBRA_006645 [Plasmodiophora brassicae]|nr:hypothetical protein PBRA_006645 [Plasmodiophora brassicae]